MRLENNRNNKNKTNVYILGDSIVKNLNGYLLTKKIRHKHLVKVRLFSWAKISCMRDHVKPTLRNVNPDHMDHYMSCGKWSGPGHFSKSQGKFFLSFLCTLFLHF